MPKGSKSWPHKNEVKVGANSHKFHTHTRVAHKGKSGGPGPMGRVVDSTGK